MASRSADCVFGIARLISSTSSTFANTGPGPELELACPLVEDREPGDVGRLDVGRALDSPDRRAADRAGDRSSQHGLRRAGDILEQDVPTRRERGEHELDLLGLSVDDRLDVRRAASRGVSTARSNCSLSGCGHERPLPWHPLSAIVRGMRRAEARGSGNPGVARPPARTACSPRSDGQPLIPAGARSRQNVAPGSRREGVDPAVERRDEHDVARDGRARERSRAERALPQTRRPVAASSATRTPRPSSGGRCERRRRLHSALGHAQLDDRDEQPSGCERHGSQHARRRGRGTRASADAAAARRR